MRFFQRFGRDNVGCGSHNKVTYVNNVYECKGCNEKGATIVKRKRLKKLEKIAHNWGKLSKEHKKIIKENRPDDINITLNH